MEGNDNITDIICRQLTRACYMLSYLSVAHCNNITNTGMYCGMLPCPTFLLPIGVGYLSDRTRPIGTVDLSQCGRVTK
jgi:hypothetical protein